MDATTDVVAPTRARAAIGESLPALLMGLNVLDALFTLAFIRRGWAVEVNPLMRAAYNCSPAVFVLLKLALVSAGVGLLWSLRSSFAARVGLKIGAFAYALVVAYHLTFLLTLIIR